MRLIALIADGKQTVQELLPPGESNFPLNDYQTAQLDQRIFHTQEVGDYLKIVIIAYDDNPEPLVSDVVQAALPVLGPILGVPYAVEISTISRNTNNCVQRQRGTNDDANQKRYQPGGRTRLWYLNCYGAIFHSPLCYW